MMPEVLTEKSILQCDHKTGIVELKMKQDFVRINGDRILVKPDPVGCTINACSWAGAGMTPCMKTVNIDTGWSEFVRIAGDPICLKPVMGKTNGTPGPFSYSVGSTNQHLVTEK